MVKLGRRSRSSQAGDKEISMASVVFEEHLRIPLGVSSLDEFRAWAQAADFPESGRFDYIGGNIEVDMSPEDVFTHGTLKTELTAALLGRVKELDLGFVLSDRSRISHPEADWSVEPDIVLITHEAIETGRVKLIPKANNEPGRFVEIEGVPELIVEIVSDSSVQKDTQRLLVAYREAGIPEYWIIDARSETLSFRINVLTGNAYEPAAVNAEGFQQSAVLACHCQLHRRHGKGGYWQYALECRPK